MCCLDAFVKGKSSEYNSCDRRTLNILTDLCKYKIELMSLFYFSGTRTPVKPRQEKKIKPNERQEGLISMKIQSVERHGASET